MGGQRRRLLDLLLPNVVGEGLGRGRGCHNNSNNNNDNHNNNNSDKNNNTTNNILLREIPEISPSSERRWGRPRWRVGMLSGCGRMGSTPMGPLQK